MAVRNQAVFYKRVSPEKLNVDRQLEGLTFDKQFVEKISAASTKDRSELENMINYVRET